jgi:hypothetical protein
MNRKTRILTAVGGTAGGVAALAVNPAVRQEALRVGRFARPLGRDAARPPVPPILLPGRVVNLPGRGEVFIRDSGGTAADPAVLLLHGWTVSADLNFFPAYGQLAEAYRVIALDLRGHGRGMRSAEPFTLGQLASDRLLDHPGTGAEPEELPHCGQRGVDRRGRTQPPAPARGGLDEMLEPGQARQADRRPSPNPPTR